MDMGIYSLERKTEYGMNATDVILLLCTSTSIIVSNTHKVNVTIN